MPVWPCRAGVRQKKERCVTVRALSGLARVCGSLDRSYGGARKGLFGAALNFSHPHSRRPIMPRSHSLRSSLSSSLRRWFVSGRSRKQALSSHRAEFQRPAHPSVEQLEDRLVLDGDHLLPSGLSVAEAFNIGVQAYTYGYPLVVLGQTQLVTTTVPPPSPPPSPPHPSPS